MELLLPKIKTVRKIDWFELIDPQYVTMQIIPDSSVRNYRTEDLIRTISDQFELPIDRLVRNGFKVTGYRMQERASFEIQFKGGHVTFYVSVPKNVQPLIQRRIQSIWNKATVQLVQREPRELSETSCIYELLYKRHDIYSLHTDAKDNTPLSSILEAGKLVTDEACIFTYFDPINQLSWQQVGSEAWKKLRGGVAPRKWTSGFREAFTLSATVLGNLIGEFVTGLGSMLSEEKSIYAKREFDPEVSQHAISNLSTSTRTKMSRPAVKTNIWVMAENDLVAKTLANSFTDLADDNELKPRKVTSPKKQREVLRTMNTHKPPRVKFNSNYLSSTEAAKLVQLPGRELQEQFPEVTKVDGLQIEVSKRLTEGGMLLGAAKYKGKEQAVYMPTTDEDELCLPYVAIGGMGQGKTLGYGANKLYEAVSQGYGALAIDAARRQIGDELAKVLGEDKLVRIDLSRMVFGLDWCEAQYDERAKARLAGTVMSFFNTSADESGNQTERFIRAAVMGMKTGKLKEIMRIFEDDDYLDEVIADMPEGLNRTTLQQYKSSGDSKRMQLLSPIYNRLNIILSDPHLSACFESDNSLDMVEIITQRKAIVIDVPDDGLDSTAIDIIVNLVTSKIDLAMRLRAKVKGPESEFPFFIVLDEPHKYNKSAKIWQSAVVESRKWKLAYVFMFHYWEQVPALLQKAIKNALPHYHIYPTSKDTFRGLREEILPFEIDDALKLKRWHAINVIRSGGETITPFVARMALPPSKRQKVKK